MEIGCTFGDHDRVLFKQHAQVFLVSIIELIPFGILIRLNIYCD